MTVAELIQHLLQQDQNKTILINRDDEYWHIADLDTAMLDDPALPNPVYDYDRLFSPEMAWPADNAVIICM